MGRSCIHIESGGGKSGTRPLIVFHVRIVCYSGERGFGGSRELPFADRWQTRSENMKPSSKRRVCGSSTMSYPCLTVRGQRYPGKKLIPTSPVLPSERDKNKPGSHRTWGGPYDPRISSLRHGDSFNLLTGRRRRRGLGDSRGPFFQSCIV